MTKIKEVNSSETTKYFKVSTTGAVFFSILLAITSFYSGMSWVNSRGTTPATKVDTSNATPLTVTKSNKPELSFFVMSFCPYGNQMEDILRPVYDLFKDKADITPHYIFDRIANLPEYCKARSGDPSQCSSYVDSIKKSNNPNPPFTTVPECVKYLDNLAKECLDEKNYIKASTGTYYASLHGRVEANQDIREICAWNQTTDKKQWWDFVGNVNKSCNAQNADSCWEEQAKKAGLDTTKITECFNKEAIGLIEKEISLTDKFKVSGSPTVLVNDVNFPPETAYKQDGKGSLLVGKKAISQDKFRTPNTFKEAICASFNKAPGECSKTLDELSGQTAAAGGCN